MEITRELEELEVDPKKYKNVNYYSLIHKTCIYAERFLWVSNEKWFLEIYDLLLVKMKVCWNNNIGLEYLKILVDEMAVFERKVCNFERSLYYE